MTSLLLALTPFVALPASAAPVIGGQLYSTGVPIRVTVLPASAGYTSELWLFEPGPARRLATNRDVGKVVDLEPVPAGAELVFGTKVLNTGNEFRMGPGSRNGDGLAHAVVDFQAEGHAVVEADPVDMVDVFGETSSVEYSSVSSLSRGVALALRYNGGAYLCGKLVNAAIACLTAGDFSASSVGQGGERHVASELGSKAQPNTKTFDIPGSDIGRRPDLVMRRSWVEVKNSAKVYFSSQIRQTLGGASEVKKTYVVVIRASTFQRLAGSPFANILKRATKSSGLAIVGCLPG